MAAKSPLNEAQRRRLLTNAQYADKLLSDVEAILAASESKSIFPKYVPDLTPAQAQLVRHSIARFREQLGRVLEGLGVTHEGPAFGSMHSIRVTLAFARIAVQEMAPQYLRGYGPLAEGVAPQLQGLCAELEGLLKRLDSALAQGSAADLQARLVRLQQTGGGVESLRQLDRIISTHGLVELRPRLSMIIERLESRHFEIAVFGRVSSGKSSLLNHILQTSVLPVGVNPITAVPTRLLHGPQPLLTVSFADRRVERLPLERLPEFVSEEHNPANVKGVVRLIAEMPSARLKDGLTFVDTPGLGSLAAAGAAETLAYLPQCDLGVVLISAGGTLNSEDLSTIQMLLEAAVPVKVLLSKADLLAPADLQSAVNYTAGQIRSHLGVAVDVHPVSTVASHAYLLDRWFSSEIAPLYEKHQELAQDSIRRKTGALREAVEAALKSKLNGGGEVALPEREEILAIERDLRTAAGRLEDARAYCLRASDDLRSLAPRALASAAEELAALWTAGAADSASARTAVEAAVARTAASGTQVHSYLQELARELAAALARAAAALATNDAPAEQELLDPLREMPRFDPPPVRLTLSRPWLLTPRAFATQRIHRKLRRELGGALEEAFNTYGQLVESWSRKALAELQSRFDSSADAYRAQLARYVSHGVVQAEERRAIEADLALLAETPGAAIER